MANQKLSKVVKVKTVDRTDRIHTTKGITINFKQEHTYTLDCGHKASEVVFVGKQPKSKMKCKACAKAVAAHG